MNRTVVKNVTEKMFNKENNYNLVKIMKITIKKKLENSGTKYKTVSVIKLITDRIDKKNEVILPKQEPY